MLQTPARKKFYKTELKTGSKMVEGRIKKEVENGNY
jgi:hypothetical protein